MADLDALAYEAAYWRERYAEEVRITGELINSQKQRLWVTELKLEMAIKTLTVISEAIGERPVNIRNGAKRILDAIEEVRIGEINNGRT